MPREEHRQDPVPLKPTLTASHYPDITPVMREVFQRIIEKEGLSPRIVRNLELSSTDNKELDNISKSAKECFRFRDEAMQKIKEAELNLMRVHGDFLVKENEIFSDLVLRENVRLKRDILFQNIDERIVDSYKLVQAKDLLPTHHKMCLDFTMAEFHESKIVTEGDETETHASSSTRERPKGATPRKQLPKPSSVTERSLETRRKILSLEPESVTFTDYVVGEQYERTVKLINVSNDNGRFELVPLKFGSKFRVSYEILPGNAKLVAPGMTVKIKIYFLCDSLENLIDNLRINVHNGGSLNLVLSAFREIPILRSPAFVGQSYFLKGHEHALCSTIECGNCLLGNLVTLEIPIVSTRGTGRFWILSEQSWCTATLDEVTDDNTLKVPPFFIHPMYFKLSKGESLYFTVHFSPQSFGMHLEKIFVVCDNCTFVDLDIIGDARYFEKNFIQVENIDKCVDIDLEMDENSKHFINIGKICSSKGANKNFYVTNTSLVELVYSWSSRKAVVDFLSQTQTFDIPEYDLIVTPPSGVIKPNSKNKFNIQAQVSSRTLGIHRRVISLVVRDIPTASITEFSNMPETLASIDETRTLVNVVITEIEVWVEHVSLNFFVSPPVVDISGARIKFHEDMQFKINVNNRGDDPIDVSWEREISTESSQELFSSKESDLRLVGRSSIDCYFTVSPHLFGDLNVEWSCVVNNGEREVFLKLLAVVEDKTVRPSTDMLNFGEVTLGTMATDVFTIINETNSGVIWSVEEMVYDIETGQLKKLERNNTSIDVGYLCHKGSIYEMGYELSTRKSGLWTSIITIGTATSSPHAQLKSYIAIAADIVSPLVTIEALFGRHAVLMPDKILFVGLVSSFNVTLKNHIQRPVSFLWGEPTGRDTGKLKVSLVPKTGTVSPLGRIVIQVIILPSNEGDVEHFYVPCFIGRTFPSIILSIVCEIDYIHVTVRLSNSSSPVSSPTRDFLWMTHERKYRHRKKHRPISTSALPFPFRFVGNLSEINNNDELVSKKLRIKNEDTFNNNFEQEISEQKNTEKKLKKNSTNANILTKINFNALSPSSHPVQETGTALSSNENSSFSLENSLLDQCNGGHELKRLFVSTDSEFSEYSITKENPSHIVTYIFPLNDIEEIPEIVLDNLKCFKEYATAIILLNETPIMGLLKISVKNFPETKKRKNLDVLQELQRSVYNKELDSWLFRIEEGKGVVVVADPNESELEKSGATQVNIRVYADTWGTYHDVITIHISGLPDFLIRLRLEVKSSPLHFPMFENSISPEPVLRFGTLHYRGEPRLKRVIIANRSSVPIGITWHVFLYKSPQLEPEVNCIIDLCTPLDRDEHFHTDSSIKNICNRYSTETSDLSFNDELLVQLYVTPYYGEEDYELFDILPCELILQAKSESHFYIKMTPNRWSHDISRPLEVRGVMVGIVRIPSKHKHCDGYFSRHSDRDLSPMILNLEANVDLPSLILRPMEGDASFKAFASDILEAPEKSITIPRVFVFKNTKALPAIVQFTTKKPFVITRVVVLGSLDNENHPQRVMVHPLHCVEVHLECQLTVSDVMEGVRIMNESSTLKFTEITRDSTKHTVTTHRDLCLDHQLMVNQSLRLFCSIIFPSLEVSTAFLDFKDVYLGDTKTLYLTIRNLSANAMRFEVRNKNECPVFRVVPRSLVIGCKGFGQVQVFFTPEDCGIYRQELVVETCVPGYMLTVEVLGAGTLDEKFYNLCE